MTLCSIEVTALYTFALLFVLAGATNTATGTFDRVTSSTGNLPVILYNAGDDGGPEKLHASASSLQTFRAPPIQPIPSIIISSDTSAEGYTLNSRPSTASFQETSGFRDKYSPGSSPAQHVSQSREFTSQRNGEYYSSSETRTSKDDYTSTGHLGHYQQNEQTQYNYPSIAQTQYDQSPVQSQQSQRFNFDTQQNTPQQIQRSDYDQQLNSFHPNQPLSHALPSDQFHQNRQLSYDQSHQQQQYYTYTANYDPYTASQPQQFQQPWYSDNSYQTRGPNNENPPDDPQLNQNQSQEGQTSAEDQSSSAQEKNKSVQNQPAGKPKRRGLLGRIAQRRKEIRNKKPNSVEGPRQPNPPSPEREDKSLANQGDNDQEASAPDVPPEQVILQPIEVQSPPSQQTDRPADLGDNDSSLEKTTEDTQVADQEPAPTPSAEDQGTTEQQLEEGPSDEGPSDGDEGPSDDGPLRPQKRNRNRGKRVRKIIGKRRRLRPGALQKFKNGSRALIRARAAFRARNGLGERKLVRGAQSQDAQRNGDQGGDPRTETHNDHDTNEQGIATPNTEIASSDNRDPASVIQKEEEQERSSSKSPRNKNFGQNRQFAGPGSDRDRDYNADEGQNQSTSSSSPLNPVDPKQASKVNPRLVLDEVEGETGKRPHLLDRLSKNHPLQPKPSTTAGQADSQYNNNYSGDRSREINSSDRNTRISQLSVQPKDRSDGQFSVIESQNDGDLQRHSEANNFGISQHGQQTPHPLSPGRRGNDRTLGAAGSQASNRNVARPRDQQRDGSASDGRRFSSTRPTDFSSRQQDIRFQDQRQRNDQTTEVVTTSQTSYQNDGQQPNQQQDSFGYTETRRVSDPTDQATFANIQLEGHLQEQRGRNDAITESRNQRTNQNAVSLPGQRGQPSFRETAKDITDLAHRNTFSNTQQQNRLQNQQDTNAHSTDATARDQFSYQNPNSPLNQDRQGFGPKTNNEPISRPTSRRGSRRQRLRNQRGRSSQTAQVSSRNRPSHRNVASEQNQQVQSSFSNSRRAHTSRSSQRVNIDNQQGIRLQSKRQRFDNSPRVTSRNRPAYQTVATQSNQQRQSSSRNAVSTDAFSANSQANTFQNQQQVNNEFNQAQSRNQASHKNEIPQSNQHQQNPFRHSSDERASSGHYTIIGNSRGRPRNPSGRRKQNVEFTTGRNPSYQNVGTDPNQYQQDPFSNRVGEHISSPSHISTSYQREQSITSTDSNRSNDQYTNPSYESLPSTESPGEHSSPDSSRSPEVVNNDFQSHPDAIRRVVKLKKPTNAHGHPAFTAELQPGNFSPVNPFQSTFETQSFNDRFAGRRPSSRKSRVRGGSRSQNSARKKAREEAIAADAVSLLHSNTNIQSTSFSRHDQGFPPARETSRFAPLSESTYSYDPNSGVNEEYFAEIVHSPVFPQASHDYFEFKIATSKRPDMNAFTSLTEIPYTGFTCDGRRPGYYADTDERAKCQSFHFCGEDGGRISYLCPEGTAFSQRLMVCDHVFRVQCSGSQTYHHMNERLYGHNYQLALGDFSTAFRDFGKKLNT